MAAAAAGGARDAAGHQPTPGLLLLQLLVSLLVRSLALEQHSSCRWVSILAGLFDVACLPVQVCQQLDEHVYMRVSN